MDPRTRIGLLAAAAVLAVTLERPGSLLLLTALCLLPVVRLRPTLRWWFRGGLVVAGLVWSTMLSQGLFYSDQPRVALGSLGPLTLYREGVIYGLVQSLRFVSVGLAGMTLALSTPTDRLHAALIRLRVPFGLALMTAAALRFVPQVAGEWATVRRARRSRGRPAWQRSPWEWLLLEVSLLRPVVARAVRRAWTLATSLDARGFDALAKRTERHPLVMRTWEAALLLGVYSALVGVVGARLSYVLYTTETAYVPALRPLYGFVRNWL
jgi:energy-coupling factor transport system permease protein